MKKRERNIILFIIFIIFGIVVAMQFKSTLYAKKIKASSALNVDILVSQIAAEQKAIDELKAAIDENISYKHKFIDEYFNNSADMETSREWSKLSLKAGFTDVKGPGVIITLDDAPVKQKDVIIDFQIIHDNDVKVILNELKKAGAQAISINGERITPVSEQVCAGPTIKVNNNRYAVPYVIQAIGDPQLLFDSVANCKQVADMLDFNIRVEIKQAKEIKIKKYSGIDTINKMISALEEVKK